MASQTGIIMICVVVSAIMMSVRPSSSQMISENVYPKYKFMFNIDDKGLHRREEESQAEGHVTGQYSYRDPNGHQRIIKYNSTPETGYQAYGDTGVFSVSDNFPKPVNSSQSAKNFLFPQAQNTNVTVKSNPVGNVLIDSQMTPPLKESTALNVVRLSDPQEFEMNGKSSLTNVTLDESSETANPQFSNTGLESSNAFYFLNRSSKLPFVNKLPEQSSIDSYSYTVLNNDGILNKLSKAPTQRGPDDHRHALMVPLNVFPYFVYPVPHINPVHLGYRYVL